MMKLVILLGLGVILFKMLMGRWVWEPKITAKQRVLGEARKTLGLSKNPTRAQIVMAHKEIISKVHPDKGGVGGSDGAAYEANVARDLLLAEMHDSQNIEPKEPT